MYRQRILEELHESHPGMNRMKALARSYVWWPQIDQQIETFVNACSECQANAAAPPSTISPWNEPKLAWDRVHADFAGPFHKRIFLVMVDAKSKWPEVLPVTTTSTQAAIVAMTAVFGRFGFPKCLVTDNGTAFTSHEFKIFCDRRAIKLMHSAPYHPNSNGCAERLV